MLVLETLLVTWNFPELTPVAMLLNPKAIEAFEKLLKPNDGAMFAVFAVLLELENRVMV